MISSDLGPAHALDMCERCEATHKTPYVNPSAAASLALLHPCIATVALMLLAQPDNHMFETRHSTDLQVYVVKKHYDYGKKGL